MADPVEAAGDAVKGAGKGAGDALGHKLGPLPVWGWIVVGGVAVAGFMILRGGGSSQVSGIPLVDTSRPGSTGGGGGGSGGGGGGSSETTTPPPPVGTAPVTVPGGVALPPGWIFAPTTPNGTPAPPPSTPRAPAEPFRFDIGSARGLLESARDAIRVAGGAQSLNQNPSAYVPIWRTWLPNITDAQLDRAILSTKRLSGALGRELTPEELQRTVEQSVNAGAGEGQVTGDRRN